MPGFWRLSLTWISWPQNTDSQCSWLLALVPLVAYAPLPVTLFVPLRAQYAPEYSAGGGYGPSPPPPPDVGDGARRGRPPKAPAPPAHRYVVDGAGCGSPQNAGAALGQRS